MQFLLTKVVGSLFYLEYYYSKMTEPPYVTHQIKKTLLQDINSRRPSFKSHNHSYITFSLETACCYQKARETHYATLDSDSPHKQNKENTGKNIPEDPLKNGNAIALSSKLVHSTFLASRNWIALLENEGYWPIKPRCLLSTFKNPV